MPLDADRIQIEFANLRNVFDHAGNAKQYFLYCFDVCRRMTSISFQKTITANASDHFLGVSVRQRCDAETNVGEDFHVDAAKTEGNKRSEQLILCHTDHQLHTVADHALYDDAFHTVLADFVEDAPEIGFVLDIQAHGADVRLMQHVRRSEFGSYRETQPARYFDRLIRCAGQPASN